MLSSLLFLSIIAIFDPGGIGTTAFPLLRVPVGARACAMGETYVGLASDVNSLFWNPAGLGTVFVPQLSLSHHEWFADIKDENLSIALPGGPGTMGIGMVYSTIDNIEIWDPKNGNSQLVTSRSGYATVGYGLPLGQSLNIGLLVKGMYDNLIDQTGTGLCLDLGALYTAQRWLRLGLAARHLGWAMRYSTDDIPLPITFSLGASVTSARLRILADINAPIDDLPDLHCGTEYLVTRHLSLRCGYRYHLNNPPREDWLSGFTAGLGLDLGALTVDYAFVPYSHLGHTHRLALRTSFPKTLFGKVRIKVVDSNNNEPVPAQFVLEGTQLGNSYTAADGTFIIDEVQTGWLKVTATADRYHPQTESILVEPRTTHELILSLVRSGFGSLWGMVYAEDTRRPVCATVTYAGPDTGSTQVNDTTGSFTFRKLRAGLYRLQVTPTNSLYTTIGDTVTIAPGSLTSRTLLLRPAGATQPSEPAPRIPAGEPVDPTPAPAPADGTTPDRSRPQ